MNPDPDSPDSVKLVLASFEVPANLPLANELWAKSTCDFLGHVQISALVLIGGRDVQIDAHAGVGRLQEAAGGLARVTFAFPANANHVF